MNHKPNPLHIVVLAAISWSIIIVLVIQWRHNSMAPDFDQLEQCQTEDSVNCAWTDNDTGDTYIVFSSTIN